MWCICPEMGSLNMMTETEVLQYLHYHPLSKRVEINGKGEVFEKALLVLVLLSYIQPFADGNKRTARIISNGILIAYGYCPISYRSVDSIEYKKAMLVFYEQNNIAPFKQIFIDQFLFAVKTYF